MDQTQRALTAGELDELLEQARRDKWTAISLIHPSLGPSDGYRVEALSQGHLKALASVGTLVSLELIGLQIGDEGARAIAALTSLTSLHLSYNGIGAEGARAIAALTSLTSLGLTNNGIGAEGARAMAALTSLTSLGLTNNGIGDEGARAIAALTSLTSLNLGYNGIGDEGARAIAALTSLTSLNLVNNVIGAEGARAIAALTSLTWLDLSNNGIGAEGARAIAALTSLTSLNLSHNEIGTEGARAIAALTSLTWLGLRNNEIGAEGARAIAALTSLTSLDLASNEIGAEGARVMAALTSLTSLGLANNEIGAEGARVIAALTSLTSLDLFNNKIGTEGARAIAALTSLTSLDLFNNKIGTEGARAIAALTSLTSLDLGANGIGAEGARAIAALTSLTSLDLAINGIGAEGARTLLESWAARPGDRLRELNIKDNGDLGGLLPPEVLDTTDAQAILAAYRRYRNKAELKPLNQAKLLVVGNEAVGKTSLIRYLIHGIARDPDEQATPRAAIHERINTEAWSPGADNIFLNVWDFGGQEIMRGTHQFFLTHRSLYLIVLEDRRQDDRSVYEWLRIVRSRGGDSPVIVVINKSDQDEVGLRLNETELQQEHGVVKVVRTSCNADRRSRASLDALRILIAATVNGDSRLRHVRDPIPQAWLRVKEAVSDLARQQRVLELRDYERLCAAGEGEDEQVQEPDEQRALLRLLHDLGVVVALGLDRDAPAARREITLLDPNWLTGAIYALITSPTVRDQDGELHREQLTAILDPALYPASRHEFILDMMKAPDLGLCFELPASSSFGSSAGWLIPEALRSNQPDYGTWPEDSLRFRYDYGHLPGGLLPRFIVQSHRNLTKSPTRWRTGVVLQAADCPILVRADRDKGRIEIAVAGPVGRRRAALNVVLNDLDAVHRYYVQLGEKALVPLPGQPDLSAVEYSHLLRLEELDGPDHLFLPPGGDRKYTVKELLDGVRRETAVDRPVRAAEPVKSAAGLPNWPKVSLVCGAVAALMALILMFVPDSWRVYVAVPFAVFAAVTVLVVSRNPVHFYRRQLAYVVGAGLLLHAVGFSLQAAVKADPEKWGSIKWDGSIHPIFYPVWCAIIGVLTYADLKTQAAARSHH